MRTRKYPLTPLAAVAKGLLAGVIGTVSMDTARYVMYRRQAARIARSRGNSRRSTAGSKLLIPGRSLSA